MTKDEQAIITGFMYLDEDHKDTFNKIVEEFKKTQGENALNVFFHSLTEAISKVNKCNYETKPPWGDSPSMKAKDNVTRDRITLDFDAGISFRFEGRKIAQKIPWDTLLRQADDYDKQYEKVWKRGKEAILKQEDYRRAWLEHVITNELCHFSVETGSKEKAEASFIQRIREEKDQFPITKGLTGVRFHIPSEQDVKDVLGEYQRQNIIRIVPKTRWVIEIVDDKEFDSKNKNIFELMKKLEQDQ